MILLMGVTFIICRPKSSSRKRGASSKPNHNGDSSSELSASDIDDFMSSVMGKSSTSKNVKPVVKVETIGEICTMG